MNSCPSTTYIHYLQEEYCEHDRFELLNKEEQERAVAFKFDQHRNLYIGAHVFLRKVLSYHTGFSPKDWKFHKNSYGKPFISNPEFKSLQFNLSHTQGMIACAVNKYSIVGVDIEGMRSLNYMKQMSRRNYTEKEHNDIFSRENAEAQLYRFYTYWTLKEALVKAIGCGLSIPLRKVGFIQRENNDWSLEKKVFSDELDTNWIFNNKDFSDNYQVSVAVSLENKADTDFYFINSNHNNTQHWKEDI